MNLRVNLDLMIKTLLQLTVHTKN